MATWVWIIVIVLVVFAAVRVFARRAALRGVDPTQVTLSPEVANQARALALQGQKIHAITLIRDHTEMPLAAATLIVDRMAAGGPRG